MSEAIVQLGDAVRRIVDRMDQERRFVIPGGDGPTVTMRLSDYDAMRDKIAALTKALDDIHRLSATVDGWRPRAMEAKRIALEALRDHG